MKEIFCIRCLIQNSERLDCAAAGSNSVASGLSVGSSTPVGVIGIVRFATACTLRALESGCTRVETVPMKIAHAAYRYR